jgi:hypothetical protein
MSYILKMAVVFPDDCFERYCARGAARNVTPYFFDKAF